MAKEQARIAQPSGDQLLQPQRGRGIAPGEFGHESHTRLFHPVFDADRVFYAEIHSARTIDRLASLTSRQDRQGAVPLVGQNKNGVHVFATGEYAETIDRRGAELIRHQVSAIRHLVANGPQFEPVGEHPQGRSMTLLPEITQPD